MFREPVKWNLTFLKQADLNLMLCRKVQVIWELLAVSLWKPPCGGNKIYQRGHSPPYNRKRFLITNQGLVI